MTRTNCYHIEHLMGVSQESHSEIFALCCWHLAVPPSSFCSPLSFCHQSDFSRGMDQAGYLWLVKKLLRRRWAALRGSRVSCFNLTSRWQVCWSPLRTPSISLLVQQVTKTAGKERSDSNVIHLALSATFKRREEKQIGQRLPEANGQTTRHFFWPNEKLW